MVMAAMVRAHGGCGDEARPGGVCESADITLAWTPGASQREASEQCQLGPSVRDRAKALERKLTKEDKFSVRDQSTEGVETSLSPQYLPIRTWPPLKPRAMFCTSKDVDLSHPSMAVIFQCVGKGDGFLGDTAAPPVNKCLIGEPWTWHMFTPRKGTQPSKYLANFKAPLHQVDRQRPTCAAENFYIGDTPRRSAADACDAACGDEALAVCTRPSLSIRELSTSMSPRTLAQWVRNLSTSPRCRDVSVFTAGGIAVAGTVGGATGLATGALVGAAAGVVPSILTLGLSIPAGSLVGACTGLCGGAIVGGSAGVLVLAGRGELYDGMLFVKCQVHSSKEYVVLTTRAAEASVSRLVNSCRGTLRSAVVSEGFQVTVASAATGAVLVGTTCAGVGTVIGSAAGAAVGVIPALFTFGLSIPIGAAIGAGTGFCTGATTGVLTGSAAGGLAGYTGYSRWNRWRGVAQCEENTWLHEHVLASEGTREDVISARQRRRTSIGA
mmetsp:Transcript_106697/g.299798  ORF Transcript_106697/g.299798 Transcript_106697/m.299798 type:complete len:497 (-) Transcript_106697:97-1587(-)